MKYLYDIYIYEIYIGPSKKWQGGGGAKIVMWGPIKLQFAAYGQFVLVYVKSGRVVHLRMPILKFRHICLL